MGKTEKDILSEAGRLERSEISQEGKDRIRAFLTDLKINNASNDRVIYYAVRLRQVASILGDKFLTPTEEDLRKALATMVDGKIGHTQTSTGKYSESAIQAFKTAMKSFYAWHLGQDNAIIRWIRIGSRKNRGRKPVEPLSESAVWTLASVAANQRDRTLIWLLYDSGCRVGELLTLEMQDVKFDSHGMMLSVSGKTGWRQVRVVGASVDEMKKWIEQYPLEKKPTGSWVFPVLKGTTRGVHMQETNVRGILKKACNKCGIAYRVYAHLFRHTRATLLAQNVAQAPLSKQMGWTQGSTMAKVYIHLSDAQQDEAILDGYEKQKRKGNPPVHKS